LPEEELFAWVDNLRKQDIIVDTKQIIIQAFAIAKKNNYKFIDLSKYHVFEVAFFNHI
jgi:hypothetical protein